MARVFETTRPAPEFSGQSLFAGDSVDHFRIIRPLGRGGMGQVYLAIDRQLGRKVALKVLDSDEGTSDRLNNFLKEARTTARFNHPNIVTIHALGRIGNVAYLALEYVEGQTLRRRTRERPGMQESLRIVLDIARGLDAAHQAGVLHCDLKPENVMIQRDGRLRVLDFGLALAFVEGRAARNEVCGTPAYMAPEQWMGRPMTAATDIWALGVIIHELLTGARPFGEARSSTLAACVVGPEPVPSLARLGHIPEPIVAIVDRCLEKQPQKDLQPKS